MERKTVEIALVDNGYVVQVDGEEFKERVFERDKHSNTPQTLDRALEWVREVLFQ